MEIPNLAEYMTDSGVAAALRSGLDGGRDIPPSSLHLIRNERPASPAIAPEQVARTTEPPSTKLPAPTESSAPVTPTAPRASSTSSLSSAPNKSQSSSSVLRGLKQSGAEPI